MDIPQNFTQKWQVKENRQTQETYSISSFQGFYRIQESILFVLFSVSF